MGVQDRDWYREEQGRKRETLDEARPHGALPPLPSWVRSTWNVVVGHLHPKEGDVSADGRKVRQRISAGSAVFSDFLPDTFCLAYRVVGLSLCVLGPRVLHGTRPLWSCISSPQPYLLVVSLSPVRVGLDAGSSPRGSKDPPEDATRRPELKTSGALIGAFSGIVGALLVFLAVYAAAIGYSGWVVGIALGWIPAILASLAAGILFRYLWWLFAIGIVGLIGYFT